MKTIRLIYLALTAVISFSSCGDNNSDSPEKPVEKPQVKHITRILQEEVNGDLTELIFSYDSEGRVTSMVEKDTDKTRASYTYTKSHTFTYGDNTIIVKRNDDETYTYSLLNGRITNSRREYKYSSGTKTKVTSYSYDNQGHLKSMNENDESNTYTWTGDNLTEIDETFQENDGERHHTYKLEYNKNTAPANYYLIGLFNSHESALAMMGNFGKMPTHLVSSINRYKNSSDYRSTTLTYKIQDDLPVVINYTEVQMRDNNPGTTSTAKITLEWN